jgi:hypothetical protein
MISWRLLTVSILGSGLLLVFPAMMARSQQSVAAVGDRPMPVMDPARTQFILRCGGCHGTLGLSPPRSVPVLRGMAGWFLCTQAGREYIVRLPNVSRAQLDDSGLADVLNFVAFDLGETSAPAGAKRFSSQEVAQIRARPLNDVPLLAYRKRVVMEMIKRCGAPRAMLAYGSPVGV